MSSATKARNVMQRAQSRPLRADTRHPGSKPDPAKLKAKRRAKRKAAR